ncbi:MAG: 4Fe-4S dicluster domain-containing protein [Deltaproteobacteria bacterium]|nr:4Fe-4S dicluster domain-containing protein [Deltaproteobacteria bacterium]
MSRQSKKLLNQQRSSNSLVGPAGTRYSNVNTGDWRIHKPVVNTELCTLCGQCQDYCPADVINRDNDTGKLIVDMKYCKGCGICDTVCAKKAIKMEKEMEDIRYD